MPETLRKTETENYKLEFDFARVLEIIWRPGRVYSTGNYVRPVAPNGFEYEATTGGQSAAREPKWPLTAGNTVQDGSVTWTARAFGTNATASIDSVNVTADTGLTISSVSSTGSIVQFTISGGERRRKYTVSIEVTTGAGQVYEEKLEVEVYAD